MMLLIKVSGVVGLKVCIILVELINDDGLVNCIFCGGGMVYWEYILVGNDSFRMSEIYFLKFWYYVF